MSVIACAMTAERDGVFSCMQCKHVGLTETLALRYVWFPILLDYELQIYSPTSSSTKNTYGER